MIKKYRIKSESDPKKSYIVHHYVEKNKFICTVEGEKKLCPSYAFGKKGFECKHILRIREYLRKKGNKK